MRYVRVCVVALAIGCTAAAVPARAEEGSPTFSPGNMVCAQLKERIEAFQKIRTQLVNYLVSKGVSQQGRLYMLSLDEPKAVETALRTRFRGLPQNVIDEFVNNEAVKQMEEAIFLCSA